MSFQAVQTRRFARQYKKLHDNVAADVDAAVGAVTNSPLIGDKKKGDLAALYVFRFRSQGQLYLLGYTIGEELKLIYLEAVARVRHQMTQVIDSYRASFKLATTKGSTGCFASVF